MNILINKLKKIFKNKIFIVGSFIRKKLKPNDIDLITLLPIKEFLELLSNYYDFTIIKKGNRISFIQISNYPELNIWYVKKDELPYTKFWLSYPKNFVSRVRHFFKLNGYKLNQYGIFENNNQVFKNKIRNNKAFFKILQSFGYNIKYRSPIEQELKGGNAADDLYAATANTYRKIFCGPKARYLYSGEKHPFCANYLGPGTKINFPNVRNFPPYSCSDAIARTHDLDYEKAFQEQDIKIRQNLIKEADEKFLRDIENCKNDFPYYQIGKNGIKLKRTLDENIPIDLYPFDKRYIGKGYY
jgi:hypothetical protein